VKEKRTVIDNHTDVSLEGKQDELFFEVL